MLVNESAMDRVLRAIGGLLVFLFSYIILTGWVQVLGYIIAAALVFTAITGFCALYKAFDIQTNK